VTLLPEIDLFAPSFQRDPYPGYRELREKRPVYREPRCGNYVLTRYADVLGALRDWPLFSSRQGVAPFGPDRGFSLTSLDPPRHDRLRALVNRAFTPRRVAESRAQIEALVAELLDPVASEFDLVSAFSHPLPVFVIARMLGVPPERRADFKRWSDAIIGLLERPKSPDDQRAIREISAYFAELALERRKEPGEDLVTALVQAEVDGERLTRSELLGICVQLLVAGNETTTNLISNLVDVLADRPDLWRALRHDRSLVAATVEESLRHDSPAQNLARTCVRETELHGVRIPAGARVLLSFGAANRDPAEFDDPDAFRLGREARHIAFGFGVHYCLGAPLARLEGSVALEGLLDRFARLERAPGAERVLSTVIRGFERLPIRASC
jgi:hypothetical protein